MKKVILLSLMALLVPWLTQSKISKPKFSDAVNPQVINISPEERVSAVAGASVNGFADSKVSGETEHFTGIF